MKIRTDFVTNSSSSSFMIAKKEQFSEKQKETILKFIEENLFGEKIASTKEELDKFFLEEYDKDFSNFSLEMEDNKSSYYTQKYVQCLKAINSGMSIYRGCVSFEFEEEYADFLRKIWGKIEDCDGESFVGIDTDLYY